MTAVAPALPVGRPVDVRRRLVTASVVDALGTGLLLPLELLFLHTVVGLSLAAAGAVLSGAALLGLVLLPVAGPLVDRFGPRQVVLLSCLVRGVALGACAVPMPTDAVVALLAVTAVADRWAMPACSSLVAAVSADAAERDRTMAVMRAVRNGAMTGGALLAALVALGGEAAFRAALLTDALTFAVALVVVRGIPDARAAGAAESPTRYGDVLRDRPFVALTLANAVYALGGIVLIAGMPAYVVGVLHAPASLGAVVFAVNTALVALGQLPTLRWSRHRAATQVTAAGGVLFALSFVAYAALALVQVSTAAVCLGLVLVTGLYTVGELLHSAGSTTLSQDAAPAHARGRYLAFYQLSWASAPVLGPVTFGWLVGYGAAALWLPLAGLTLVAAAAVARLRLTAA